MHGKSCLHLVEKPLTRREAELLRTWVSEGSMGSALGLRAASTLARTAACGGFFLFSVARCWIDQFLLEAMQQNGLVPTVAADSLTLVRRIHLT